MSRKRRAQPRLSAAHAWHRSLPSHCLPHMTAQHSASEEDNAPTASSALDGAAAGAEVRVHKVSLLASPLFAVPSAPCSGRATSSTLATVSTEQAARER